MDHAIHSLFHLYIWMILMRIWWWRFGSIYITVIGISNLFNAGNKGSISFDNLSLRSTSYISIVGYRLISVDFLMHRWNINQDMFLQLKKQFTFFLRSPHFLTYLWMFYVPNNVSFRWQEMLACFAQNDESFLNENLKL